jgi:Fe-Mn family superoxide dismutase
MTDWELKPLPYDYDALEPHISEQVLRWHHDTHHQGYINGLNAAEQTLEELRASDNKEGAANAMRSVTHNGSGHILHNLFWKSMSPEGGNRPTGPLADRIEADFESYLDWEAEFRRAAQHADGWALLVYDTFHNQLRNLVVDKHDQGALWDAHPVLALDVWEHSYYHDYGPDRPSFVDAFFAVVDWDEPNRRYEDLVALFE